MCSSSCLHIMWLPLHCRRRLPASRHSCTPAKQQQAMTSREVSRWVQPLTHDTGRQVLLLGRLCCGVLGNRAGCHTVLGLCMCCRRHWQGRVPSRHAGRQPASQPASPTHVSCTYLSSCHAAAAAQRQQQKHFTRPMMHIRVVRCHLPSQNHCYRHAECCVCPRITASTHVHTHTVVL